MRATSFRRRAIRSTGNDFGFSVGGPVYIPKVYNGKNKTFFFVLLGYIKERREQRFNQIVPTMAYRERRLLRRSARRFYDPLDGSTVSRKHHSRHPNRCQRRGLRQDVSEPELPRFGRPKLDRAAGRHRRHRREELPRRSPLQRQPPRDVALHAGVSVVELQEWIRASTSLRARTKRRPAT